MKKIIQKENNIFYIFIVIILLLIIYYLVSTNNINNIKEKFSTGTVKWFNITKGFGFLTLDDSTNDVFIHFSQIDGDGDKSLNEGDLVEFDIAQGPKGPQAQNIRLAR